MANDLSNPVNAAAPNQASQDDVFDHGNGADGLFGKDQLAQAGSGAAAQTIQVPAPDATGGPVVVRIDVAPGSTIELPQPFDADATLLAKEGDGNLAIRVGDVTVILQGYVDANSAQPVIVEGADNQPIDIATVLAATDPAIDIQTAAGPDAGQGGQGADNTGAILAQLDGGEGLGGLAAVGGQDQTQLSYALIDGSIRQEFATTLAAGPVFGFSVGAISGTFNEGFLRDPAQTTPFGNSSGTFFATFMDEYRDAVEHPGQAMFAGWADFHGTAVTQNNDFDEYLSQTGKTTTVDAQFTGGTGDLVLTGIGNDVTSNGSPLHAEFRDDGHTMFLRRDDDNALVAVVHVEGPDASGQFTIETFLINRIDHDGAGTGNAGKDTMDIDVQFTVYDGPAPNPEQEEQGGPTSPAIEGSFSASFADDVPILEDVRYHNQHEDKVPAARASEGGSDSNIGLIDEDWLKGGAHDEDAAHQSNAGEDGDTGGGTCVTGCIVVNFGADGAAKSDGKTEDAGKHAFVLDTAQYKLGDAFPYNGGTLTSGKETLVVLSVGPDHLTVGLADGKQPMPTLVGAETNDASPIEPIDPIPGCPVFTLTLDPDTGSFKFELKGPLDHNPSGSIFGDETGVSALAEEQPEQTIPLEFGVKAYDDDGDWVQAEIDIDVNDDVPVARNDEDTVAKGSFAEISGNVMSGLDTDSPSAGKDSQGGDHATVTGILSAVATGVVGKEIQGSYGKLVLNEDGSYTYTRDHGPDSKGGVDDVFTYTLTDGDGDTSTATLTIHIKDSGVCIELPSCPADTTVSEAGLPARPGEAPGSNQFSDSEETGGTITIDAKDGIASLQIGSHELTLAELKDLGNTPLKIADPTGELTLTGFNESTGALTYTYVLKDNTLNTNGSSVSFDITVKDADADAKTATLTIKIQDDAPTANCDERTFVANKDATADVQFILDVSGSMESRHVSVPGYPDNGVGLERYSLEQMLNAHPEIQNVQIVLFDDHASHSEWMTRDEAIAWVKDGDNFDHGGGATNYDAALNEAMESFVETRPLPQSDQTLVYFFSDGNPNQPGGSSTGINNNGSGSNVSTAEWEAFVNGHAISNVFVVGVGTIDGTEFSQLTPISYPNTDAHAPAGEDNVLNITSSNVGTLLDSLNHSIVPVLNTFTGDLTQNDVSGADGFGSGKLVSATYDGINYIFNATTHEHTIDLGAGRGTLVLKDDGTYAYTPPVESKANGKPFAIDYTIQDGDGDQSTAQLKIDINTRPVTDLNGAACEGADNKVYFQEDYGAIKIAPLAAITDDSGKLTSMTVTLAGRPDGAHETLSLNADAETARLDAGLAITNVNGVITISGAAVDASVYQTILRGIVYNNASDTPNTSDRTVTVTVKDEGNLVSTSHTVTIDVDPTNDAPTAVIAPASFNAVEQTSLTLSGKGLSIGDVDAGNGTMTVTLKVGEGWLGITNGNTGVWVTNNGSDSVTLIGTVAQINNLLDGKNGGAVSYYNDSDTPSSQTTLTLKVDDNGHTGEGPDLTASDTAIIYIENTPEAPVACSDHVITNAGSNLFNIPEWALLYNDSDPDTANSNLHLVSGAAGVLNPSGGTVGHPNGADYVTFDDSNGNGHSEFDYKMTDGSQFSTAEVEVSQDSLKDGELNGGSGDDIIVVYGSAGVTVKADGGDDIVIGGSGKDRLDGGSGDDLIFGQGGDDTMIFSSINSSGDDKFDGGTGFDRIQLTNGNISIGYDTAKFINVEMIDLGDSNPRDFSENKLALSAGDLVAGHAGSLGGHSIALYVIGDNTGNSTGKDNVDLNGFNMVAIGSVNNVTDAATGQSHSYDIYQGTGVNAGVKVAVEHGLDVM